MTHPVYPTLEHTAKFYQQELVKIYEFLKPLKGIWSEEVLNQFPDTLEAYPASWLQAMEELDFEKHWLIEIGTIPTELESSGLTELFKTLEELEAIPQWDFSKDMQDPIQYPYPSWALNYVTEKKQHEIRFFSQFIDQTLPKSSSSLKFIDIGGGKGHLARILALYHGHHVTTLDTNAELQTLGKERLDKYPYPTGAGSLTFLNHTFGKDSEDQKLDRMIFEEAQATLGLHTCGPLALEHIQTYQDHHGLYNFGCCYQKLDWTKEVNLSEFSQEHTPLELGKFALTLATRGHTKINFKDYELKKRVKLYRAALHLWMSDNTTDNTFITVGSAKARDYFESFGTYAHKKLQKFNLYESQDTLDDFYQREDIQKKIHTIFHANLIRWRFGRILEKFILLNRALWQVEKGRHAQLYQVFDSELSPRNTVLFIPPNN